MNTPSLTTPPPGGAGRTSLQSTTGRIAAVATALLLVLFLVLSVSRAAFTASTDNSGNSIEAGTVTLTDNDNGSALFTIADASPGVETVKCIQVRYEGAFDSGDIKMYVTPAYDPIAEADYPDLGVLAPYVDVKIESEDLGDVPLTDEVVECALFEAADLLTPLDDSPVVYDGTLSQFGQSYANGESAPAPDEFTADGNSTRTFKVTVSVQNDPAAAGAGAAWDFIWETQSA